MNLISRTYDDAFTRNKIIITTEKDAMRLIKSDYISMLGNVPLFYIPIEVKFHGLDNANFSNQIKKYVRENKRDISVY